MAECRYCLRDVPSKATACTDCELGYEKNPPSSLDVVSVANWACELMEILHQKGSDAQPFYDHCSGVVPYTSVVADLAVEMEIARAIRSERDEYDDWVGDYGDDIVEMAVSSLIAHFDSNDHSGDFLRVIARRAIEEAGV